MPVFLLSEKIQFPPPHLAIPEGLLAIGGDLSPDRLLLAYRKGIFPWYADGQPILWWTPDPRLVLYPEAFRISRSLKKTIRKAVFRVTMDTAFAQVIEGCAKAPRKNEQGTWIVRDMIEAYTLLHDAGYAHSVEAWHDGKLAGGLYGVSLGRCFFGESMFTVKTDASKVALARLIDHLLSRDFHMVDCQVTTAHMTRFGAVEVPRRRFLLQLQKALHYPTLRGAWKPDA